MGILVFRRQDPLSSEAMIAKWGRRGSRTSLSSLTDQNDDQTREDSHSTRSSPTACKSPNTGSIPSQLTFQNRKSSIVKIRNRSISQSSTNENEDNGFQSKDVVDISAFIDKNQSMQRYTTIKNVNSLERSLINEDHSRTQQQHQHHSSQSNGFCTTPPIVKNLIYARSESAPIFISMPPKSSSSNGSANKESLNIVPEDYSLTTFDSVFDLNVDAVINANGSANSTDHIDNASSNAFKYFLYPGNQDEDEKETSQCERADRHYRTISDSTSSSNSLDKNCFRSPTLHGSIACTDESFSSTEDLDVKPVPKPRRKKAGLLDDPQDIFKYINSENCFEVSIEKCSRGLGICIFGGKDLKRHGPVCQLIRIRQLYPLQPASICGQLEIGDVILEVNGLNMIGLTHMEALETLRVASANLVLKIYRPDSTVMPPISFYVKENMSPNGNLLSPPGSACNTLTKAKSSSCNSLQQFGDIELTLTKRDGSLGFSILQHINNNSTTTENDEELKENEEIHPDGFYVKALIREPALFDGRIQPGDRILFVNGKDISSLSHREAVSLLRSEGENVSLILNRSPGGDPLSAPASLEEEDEDVCHLAKPLRFEAREMLSDRAKQKAANEDSTTPERKMKERGLRKGGSRSSLKSSSSGEDVSSVGSPVSAPICVVIPSQVKPSLSETDFQSSPKNVGLSNGGSSLNRNLRPKSLDLLCMNEKKQQQQQHHQNGRLEEQSESLPPFHRQASVVVTSSDLLEKQSECLDQLAEGQGLIKWRGTTLNSNEENLKDNQSSPSSLSSSVCLSPEIESTNRIDTEVAPPVPPKRLTSLPRFDSLSDSNFKLGRSDLSAFLIGEQKYERIFVDIDRGWHGRLGFSLSDSLPNTSEDHSKIKCPVVKAIYDGSIAQRDGRICAGDKLYEVNGESLLNKTAAEVIDLLRKTRGKMRLILIRFVEESIDQSDSTA